MTGPDQVQGRREREMLSILLATYNGMPFVTDQLQSLIGQTVTDWTLWARDDGSTDGTVVALRRAAERDHRIRLLDYDGRRLGSSLNFATLLAASYQASPAAYVMFCDQDDVWRPDKIEVTFQAMRQAETDVPAGTPILVHTDFEFVDEQLQPLGSLATAVRRLSSRTDSIFNRLLSQNFIYGCTMMLNSALVQACTPVPPEAEQHDYWVALVAAAVGRVVHLPTSTVSYRQHGSNVTGNYAASRLSRRIHRVLAGWHETERLNSGRVLQANALARSLRDRLPRDRRQLLEAYGAVMAKGGVRAAWFAYRHGLQRQGPLQTGRYLISLMATRPRRSSGRQTIDELKH